MCCCSGTAMDSTNPVHKQQHVHCAVATAYRLAVMTDFQHARQLEEAPAKSPRSLLLLPALNIFSTQQRYASNPDTTVAPTLTVRPATAG